MDDHNNEQDLIDSLGGTPARGRPVSALLGGSGMSTQPLFPQASTQPPPRPVKMTGKPVSALLGGSGMATQPLFPQAASAPTIIPGEQTSAPAIIPFRDDPAPKPTPSRTDWLTDASGEKHQRSIDRQARREAVPDLPEAPQLRRPEMRDPSEPMKRLKPQDTSAPLVQYAQSSLQGSMAGIPILGQLSGAFAPLIGLMKAFGQSKDIGSSNQEKANQALVESMKIEEDNRKKAAKALEDFEKALDRGQKAAEKSFRDSGMSSQGAARAARDWRTAAGARGSDGASLSGLLSGGGSTSFSSIIGSGGGASLGGAAGAAGAGGASGIGSSLAGLGASMGAVLGPIAAAGAALAAIPATAMAVTEAFNSVAKTAAGFAEAYAPSSVLVFNQSLRDITAVIGSGLLPIVSMATAVYREVGATLLPVMNELRPVIQAFSNAFGEVAIRTVQSFGKVASVASEFVDVLAGAASPLADAFNALGDIGMAMFQSLVVAVRPLLPALSVLVEGFRLMVTPLVMLGDAARVAGTVLQALGEAFTATVAPLMSLNLTSALDGLRSGFQSIIRATVSLGFAFLKLVGFLDTAFGKTFADKAIKAFQNPEGKQQSAVGLAAATDAGYSSFQEFGRRSAQEAAFAFGAVGDKPKSTDEWLKGIAEDLDSIRKGEGNGAFADAIAAAIERVLDKMLGNSGRYHGPVTKAELDLAKSRMERQSGSLGM